MTEESTLTQLHRQIIHYHIPENAVNLLEANTPLILAAPTAIGKDAIAGELVLTGQYQRVVTHTTRQPREGESDGTDYWFVSEEKMLSLVESKSFIEVKIVHGDTAYGSSITAYQLVVDNGKTPILVIDVQGVDHIRQRVKNIEPFFILPPSFEDWMKRLESRGPVSYTEKSRRLGSARSELQEAVKNPHFKLVVNHEIKDVVNDIRRGTTDAVVQHRNRELAERLIHHIASY